MVFSVIMEGTAPGSGMFKLPGRNPSRKCSFGLKSRNPVRRIFSGKEERQGRKDRGDEMKRRIGLLLTRSSCVSLVHGGSVQVWR